MVKASSLYIVIIIALVIGLICSSLIVVAYFYKTDYQKKFRYDRLESNLNSGINILVAGNDTAYTIEKKLSLFGDSTDSVSLKNIAWGVYAIGAVRSFIQKDTLFKAFLEASSIDSSKWAALYLIDEDRPFSLSGNTMIRGDAWIPKAGVQQAYVDNKAYGGDKRLIIGTKHTSDKSLPPLDDKKLQIIENYFKNVPKGDSAITAKDSINVSFFDATQVFNFKKKATVIRDIRISGNVILYSDTTLTLDNSAKLSNVLVIAKAIIVTSGFSGNCQLFATDSIAIAKDCTFNYPSSLGIIRYQVTLIKGQEKISIGDNSVINGIIFTYEKQDNPLKPLIDVSKGVKIKGQVYSQGIALLKDSVAINGSIFTSRFLYKSSFTLYENYLINATLNSKALSPYYLTSGLLPVAGKKKKILQWLESK